MALSLASSPLSAQERGAAALAQEVAGIGNTMRVLLIAAHPDDEDTQLISWLSHGQHVETAYLSLTRGDGGQNLIGNELGEALGVIRSAELMQARRIDGAKQYFTRAYDFGFSKDTVDTFRHWPRDSVLRDAVRVVREFAPHVIVAIFSGTPRDGHGQHQVSAIIAKEVWTAAADTLRFPIKQFGAAWTPLKFYRAARFAPAEATLRFNVGEYNSTLGKSYFEIAAESRSQHKSQGFGALQRKGVIWDYVRREETRVPAPEDPKLEKSMFDGIACRGARQAAPSLAKGLNALGQAAPAVRAEVIRRLAAVQRAIEAAKKARAFCGSQREGERTFEVMASRVNSALVHAADITFEAFASRKAAALGDTFTVTSTIYNRGTLPIMVRGGNTGNGEMITVLPDSSFETKMVWNDATIDGKPVQFPGTQPIWLRAPRNGDLFGSQPSAMDVLRPGLEMIQARASVKIDSALIELSTPVSFRYADPVLGDVQRPFAIEPGISINFDRSVEIARSGVVGTRFFGVAVRSAFPVRKDVLVKLNLPKGLDADSISRVVSIGPGGTRTATFRVTGSLPPGTHEVSATAVSDGKAYVVGYVPVEYEHIPPQRMYRAASVKINAIPVTVRAGLNIGYVRGVGDNVPATLRDLGLPVTIVSPDELPSADLSRFTTIVIGTRAYQANQELIDNNSYLLDFARRGGTVVSQYGQYEMTQPGVLPYPITIARPAERVTDEKAEVRITDAASPLLTSPNKITIADFTDWVQERSSYMPATFDANYKSLLSMNDSGETPKTSGILVTPVGKGLYIYTTLSFFRQLPAGNPGATRLFVNLLSAKAAR